MNTFKYDLLKILKEMDENFYNEANIPQTMLIEFCEIMLASTTALVTFVAMFDTCSCKSTEKDYLKTKFFKLSRYIDKQIVYSAHEVEIFRRYDREMNRIYECKDGTKKLFLGLTKIYKKNNHIFNFGLLNSEENVEVEQNHQQSYQFDPANLMV